MTEDAQKQKVDKKKQIEELLYNAVTTPDKVFRTEVEWRDLREKKVERAILFLKERLLGSHEKRTIKSIDDIAKALVEIGVSLDITKAKEIVPKLEGHCWAYEYSLDRDRHFYLTFTKATDYSRNVKYLIKTDFSCSTAVD